MRAAIRRAGLRHRQACQSLRRRASPARIADAYAQAYRTDPTSAFGGIIAFNRELDAATARAIVDQQFVEVILAPSVSERGAVAARRQETMCACSAPATCRMPVTQLLEYKSVAGGLLVQTRDDGVGAAAGAARGHQARAHAGRAR